MRLTRQTRWIIALIMLSIGVRALGFAPVLREAAFVFWGLSLAFLIGALLLAVRRLRTEPGANRRAK